MLPSDHEYLEYTMKNLFNTLPLYSTRFSWMSDSQIYVLKINQNDPFCLLSGHVHDVV